jgi:hypothetical protein
MASIREIGSRLLLILTLSALVKLLYLKLRLDQADSGILLPVKFDRRDFMSGIAGQFLNLWR